MAAISHPVVTDLTKDLYLYTSEQNAWLYVALTSEEKLVAGDLVVTDIRVGALPHGISLDSLWESRPGGIWVYRSGFSGKIDEVVTGLDVLFGTDAVDPRPQWTLSPSSLEINAPSEVPVAKLSVRRGRAKGRSDTRAPLRVREDGKFRIVQISDTHMVTGVGVCNDAIDARGNFLPDSDADPLTVRFVGKILDAEEPDLVVLTGDQLHHDIPDSRSALFKVVAPMIERSIPFAAVFGNHDSEGAHALSRTAQMSILEDLPSSLCESGPEQVDGIGNYHLQILAPAPSQQPLSTMYFLDSHGQISGNTCDPGPDYESIKQSQIDWVINTSRAQRNAREKHHDNNRHYPTLAFLHIPLPEFGDQHLDIRSGHRREPTEGPKLNSHFYDVLAKEGVSAMGCGHDHVNDFCALLPDKKHDAQSPHRGPWLCYGGGSGFGGYCSYGTERFHRRARVWEIDTTAGSLKTWTRVEYMTDRVDELVLVGSEL